MRTQFSTFREPELLASIGTSTAVPTQAVANAEALIDRIDEELQPPTARGNDTVRAWTHVGWDPEQIVTRDPVVTVTTIYVPNWESVGGPVRVLWSSEPVYITNSESFVDEPIRVLGAIEPVHVLPPEPTRHLDSSLAEIQSWLGVGLDAASQAAGISRGTVYAWRQRGSSPRPATVSAIMRVHGLVASVVKAVGVERAREWFHAGSPSPLSEMLDAKGDAARLGSLSTRVRRELLRVPTPPPNPLLAATADDIVR